MTEPTTADFAAAYVRKYGMAIVPLPPRAKRPSSDDWGNQCLTTPEAARQHFSRHPDDNLGAALGPSRLCSLDIDDMDAMRVICEEFGWSLDTMLAQHPTIQGRAPGFRVMFRVPDGVTLAYHSLTWPNRDDPKRRKTVFEIRAADTQQRQDVLPPSIHPDTGKPYIWLTKPNGVIPDPPAWLLSLWQNWDALKPQLQGLCPWAPQRPTPKPPKRPRPANATAEPSVIDAYDQAHDIEAALAQYGYRQQGKRWLSPHSSTGLAGVVVFDGKAWIHHASDPLCSDESGQLVGAFDLFRYYDHGGDMTKAVKAAAEELGMKQVTRKNDPRPKAATLPAVREIQASAGGAGPSSGTVIDSDTGEIVSIFDPLPDVIGKAKKPLATIENLVEICRRLEVTVRYNVISKEEEMLIPKHSFSMDNKANASLAWLTSWCKRIEMPTQQVGDYLTFMADQNLHNPVANWIESKPWDGQSRLQDLFDTIGAVGESQDSNVRVIKETLMRRWLLSAVAAAFQPNGVSAHGVLVFQGAQYMGKTAWFKRLAPKDLGVVQDGMMLRPDDRDSVKQVVSHWLVELGELDATFRKSDIAQLKAFLTRDKDILRRAYARKESEFARRTVFFASVNPREFLHDQTGNRRFWTIECSSIDYDHGIDMQQLWAEVLTLYRNGEPWVLQGDEHSSLEGHNKEFEVIDPIEDLIGSGLRWSEPPAAWRWRSATEILVELGRDTCTQGEATRAALIVRARNGGLSRKANGMRQLLAPDPWGMKSRP
jgi:predicted P-loop ATPase